jgi:hypothetical protein
MGTITANNIDKWQKDFLHALSNEDSSLEEIQTAIQAKQGNLQERARTATIGQIPVAGP